MSAKWSPEIEAANRPRNLGRAARVQVDVDHTYGFLAVVRVIDCGPGRDEPKRVRIIEGPAGWYHRVLKPGQYRFRKWMDE